MTTHSSRFALALLLFALAPSLQAQTYPGKPVRVIIVFPPGGSNDVTARIVFSKMAAITGQQFVLENAAGQGVRSGPSSSRRARRTATR